MTRTRLRRPWPWTAPSGVLVAALCLGWALPGRADDPPKDEALDRILEKIDAPSPDAPKADAGAKPDAPRPDAPRAEDAKPKAEAPGPSGEVAPKDEAIDSILEKLGETKDAPDSAGKPAPKPAGGPKEDEPPTPGDAPKPDQPKPESLKGRDKTIDERLEELTGRKRKDPHRDEDSGMLADSIKQMREVEKRLSQPDTGEETRKKQQEILKKLDQVLEQVRIIRVKGQGKPQPGDKPQPGSKSNEPGSQAGEGQMANTKPKLPKKPDKGNGKDPWGQLPADLQVDKANSFGEQALPGKESLVNRYFESVAKKAAAGEK